MLTKHGLEEKLTLSNWMFNSEYGCYLNDKINDQSEATYRTMWTRLNYVNDPLGQWQNGWNKIGYGANWSGL